MPSIRKPASDKTTGPTSKAQSFREGALLKEYERVCNDIRSLESSHDKTVGLGLALLIGCATLGYQHEVGIIFLALPFGAIGVLFYELQIFAYIYSLGGYKRHLESEINRIASRKAICWEEIVRLRGTVNPTGQGLLATVVILNLGIVSFSIIQLSRSNYTASSVIFVAIMCAALLVWLIYSAFSLRKIYEFMQERAAESFDSR